MRPAINEWRPKKNNIIKVISTGGPQIVWYGRGLI